MLIAGFPAGSFAANCYIVASEPGAECLIIDPGQDAEAGIEKLVAKYRLRPAAVLATHGHIDHIWSVAPVCGARNIPAYIHPDDRGLVFALEELSFFSKELRVLGVYPAHPFRETFAEEKD